MTKAKRCLSALTAIVLAMTLLTACGTSPSSSSKAPSSYPSSSEPSLLNESGQYIGEAEAAAYPLSSEKKKLTIYKRDSSSGVIGNWGNIKAFQVAAEKLGVELEFIHPAVGSEADQFNLMIASNKYPDIIVWDFASTPMGLEELVNSGTLIDMDNLIRQYAPNYLKTLEKKDAYKSEAITNNGHYLAMYGFGENLPISGGPTIRGDLLKKYNLEVPVTVDDWTNVMTTLKEKDTIVKYPLTSGKGRDGSVWFDLIMPAFKTAQNFCLDDKTGSIVFGPAEDNYKAYLAKLNEWYELGLIDPEFMSNDGKNMNAKLADGTCVAGSLQLNYHIANITKTARESNPTFEFEGATWPVLNKGDKAAFPIPGGIYYSGEQATITSSCADPVLAMQVLDFFYSQEGNELTSFGINGESYQTNTDGSKTFTDNIMKNPEGKIPSEAILQYAVPTYGFSNLIQSSAHEQMTTTLPEQGVARVRWLDATSGINMPRLTVAAEVQSDYNMMMNDINTYVQEMYIKFIAGQANLDGDWDKYVSTLKSMDLETATKHIADAYKLYQAR